MELRGVLAERFGDDSGDSGAAPDDRRREERTRSRSLRRLTKAHSPRSMFTTQPLRWRAASARADDGTARAAGARTTCRAEWLA